VRLCGAGAGCKAAIGLRVKDGIVLAVEKIVHSKLLIPAANRRIQTVDRHIGMVRAAMARRVRTLTSRARRRRACSRTAATSARARATRRPTTARRTAHRPR
jgi:20S proteasome alpha/beta subunit